LSEKVVRVNRE